MIRSARPGGSIRSRRHRAHRASRTRSSFNSTGTLSIYGVVPSYGLLNLRVGLRASEGHLDLSFWARNALNKNYYVGRNPGTFGLITSFTGDPRTVGATLRAKW